MTPVQMMQAAVPAALMLAQEIEAKIYILESWPSRVGPGI